MGFEFSLGWIWLSLGICFFLGIERIERIWFCVYFGVGVWVGVVVEGGFVGEVVGCGLWVCYGCIVGFWMVFRNVVSIYILLIGGCRE